MHIYTKVSKSVITIYTTVVTTMLTVKWLTSYRKFSMLVKNNGLPPISASHCYVKSVASFSELHVKSMTGAAFIEVDKTAALSRYQLLFRVTVH